jgi:hypothetical protein
MCRYLVEIHHDLAELGHHVEAAGAFGQRDALGQLVGDFGRCCCRRIRIARNPLGRRLLHLRSQMLTRPTTCHDSGDPPEERRITPTASSKLPDNRSSRKLLQTDLLHRRQHSLLDFAVQR